MPTPIVLTLDGKTVHKPSRHSRADVTVDEFEVALERDAVVARAVKFKLFRRVRYGYAFPFAGSTFERLDASRSSGKAAVGAVAGALLAGPLGLLVGAAVGGGKRHSLVVQHGSAALVFDVSTAELQALAGKGVLGD